jgi:hypothetical protein
VRPSMRPYRHRLFRGKMCMLLAFDPFIVFAVIDGQIGPSIAEPSDMMVRIEILKLAIFYRGDLQCRRITASAPPPTPVYPSDASGVAIDPPTSGGELRLARVWSERCEICTPWLASARQSAPCNTLAISNAFTLG